MQWRNFGENEPIVSVTVAISRLNQSAYVGPVNPSGLGQQNPVTMGNHSPSISLSKISSFISETRTSLGQWLGRRLFQIQPFQPENGSDMTDVSRDLFLTPEQRTSLSQALETRQYKVSILGRRNESSPEKREEIAVLLGEYHVKSCDSKQAGTNILEAFSYRGLEGIEADQYWLPSTLILWKIYMHYVIPLLTLGVYEAGSTIHEAMSPGDRNVVNFPLEAGHLADIEEKKSMLKAVAGMSSPFFLGAGALGAAVTACFSGNPALSAAVASPFLLVPLAWGIAELVGWLAGTSSRKYPAYVENRNPTLARNAEKFLATIPAGHPALIFTGVFHTDGIEKLLLERGFRKYSFP